MIKETSPAEIDAIMQQAWTAFQVYRKFSLKQRAAFMQAIAIELEACGDELIHTAMRETNLPEARLRGERARTIYQLNSYADACIKGDWLEARIDTALPDKTPPKPDIRKMLVPLGPVVVFGASNFPFAYSTAGGDTASAFAAGCPVVIKGHPAHPQTSEMAAQAIIRAAKKTNMPDGIFGHVTGTSFDIGKALVMHPHTKAVGFTGSYGGGKQLFDWANQRKEPIPVFAEMGSVNPVFLLPGKLEEGAEAVAEMYAGSVTLGVGQFCTNPGLIIGIADSNLARFIHGLGGAVEKVQPALMLHSGIAANYHKNKKAVLAESHVKLVGESVADDNDTLKGEPAIAATDGKTFLQNPLLHQEVFGPFSLVVQCADEAELQQVIAKLEGQLTATIMATAADLDKYAEVVSAVEEICGRIVLNGVPTGVEVCPAMHHGGPFPASTDSRFTSVGEDAIKRFARPLAFQNWPDNKLPDELKEGNPLGIYRMYNGKMTK